MWFAPPAVLSIDGSAGLITFLHVAGRPISVALEDVRHSIIDEHFAEHILKKNDQLDDCLDTCFNEPSCSESLPAGGISSLTCHRENFDSDFSNDIDVVL